MRSYAAAALLLGPLALVSCTEENAGPLSGEREPTSISISAADIELDDGDTLQLFANLVDQNDNVFSTLPEDVEIAWSSGDADIVEALPDGRLVAVAPGQTSVRAEAGDNVAVAQVRVRQVASAMVVIEETDDQDGLPNSPLADSVALRVIDRHGNGVAGVEVRFRTVSGGGSVSPAFATTDASGMVHVQWTLGPIIGDQQMQAVAPGAGTPVTIDATISRVVFGNLDFPATGSVGSALIGTVRVDSNLFPAAIGAVHVVLRWDPSKLQYDPAAVGSSDYARSVNWYDNATGELHWLSSDPAVARGNMTAAAVGFAVVGGAGTSTPIELEIEQLVAVDYQDASAAGVAADVVVTIN